MPSPVRSVQKLFLDLDLSVDLEILFRGVPQIRGGDKNNIILKEEKERKASVTKSQVSFPLYSFQTNQQIKTVKEET